MNVLLVDDYWVTTDLLADVVFSMGHSVKTTYSAAEPLATTSGEATFDLILLNIALPDINGHERCLWLRLSEKYASRRTIYLSAHVDLCERFGMSCFDDSLLKPLSLSEFECVLSELIEP